MVGFTAIEHHAIRLPKVRRDEEAGHGGKFGRNSFTAKEWLRLTKEVLRLVEKRLVHGAVIFAHQLRELLQLASLLRTQLRRNLDQRTHHEVASIGGIQDRHPATAQLEHRPA